jgi:hypothetical protein
MRIRTLYHVLLRLHPPRFRERFEEEMMAVFDDATRERHAVSLLADIIASLFRQWLIGGPMMLTHQAASGYIRKITFAWLALLIAIQFVNFALGHPEPAARYLGNAMVATAWLSALFTFIRLKRESVLLSADHASDARNARILLAIGIVVVMTTMYFWSMWAFNVADRDRLRLLTNVVPCVLLTLGYFFAFRVFRNAHGS